MKVAIIGGGASGISAAISIKKNHPEVDVTILERFERIGKKILATGNGKCNIGNLNIDPSYYNDKKFVSHLISLMPIDMYTDYLKELGIYLTSDSEGRIYPYSNSSKTVLDILLRNLKRLNIKIITSFNVTDCIVHNDGYLLVNESNDKLYFDKVVFSYGSSAQTKEVTIYNILKKYNHHIIDFTPKLVPLKVKEKVKDISGLRFKVKVSLIVEDKKVFEENGEIIFKDEGIGGIVILNLSRFIEKNKKNVIMINFINNQSFDLDTYLSSNKKLSKSELLEGIVHKTFALKLANISNSKSIKESLTNFELTVVGDYGVNQAQVIRGGVSLANINANTFESNKQKGLYIIGEALNIDGACGGYNLYFAIASGAILGKNLFTN